MQKIRCDPLDHMAGADAVYTGHTLTILLQDPHHPHAAHAHASPPLVRLGLAPVTSLCPCEDTLPCDSNSISESAKPKPHMPLPCGSDFFHGSHYVPFIFIILIPNRILFTLTKQGVSDGISFRDEARL